MIDEDGVWQGTEPVPAGSWAYKAALNMTWSESYGDATYGLPDGNIPLAIDQDTELRFTYDHATHKVTVGPAAPPDGLTDDDRALVEAALLADFDDQDTGK